MSKDALCNTLKMTQRSEIVARDEKIVEYCSVGRTQNHSKLTVHFPNSSNSEEYETIKVTLSKHTANISKGEFQ